MTIKTKDEKLRSEMIIKLRISGLPYEAIGVRFNLTRERVRQILKHYRPDLIGRRILNDSYRQSKLKRETRICRRSGCGETFLIAPSASRKYCSHKCRLIVKDFKKIPFRSGTREYTHAAWIWEKKNRPNK